MPTQAESIEEFMLIENVISVCYVIVWVSSETICQALEIAPALGRRTPTLNAIASDCAIMKNIGKDPDSGFCENGILFAYIHFKTLMD